MTESMGSARPASGWRHYLTVDAIGERLGTVLLLTFLPVPLTSLVYALHSIATDTPAEAYGMPSGYLVYGVVNGLVVLLLYAVLTPGARRDVFLFERPSGAELGSALVAFVVGLGVYQATARVNAALGFELSGLGYSLGDPAALAAVVVGAVVLAPITEEVLYRGLVLGGLTSAGFGTASATALMTALFALIHLPNFGVAGTVFISAWGVLPALLRLRFENLTGAVLMHMLNNCFAYVVVVSAGWAT